MTTAQDLIQGARTARAADDEARAQRQEVALRIQERRRLDRAIERGKALSLQAEKVFLKAAEAAVEREIERDWFYALVSAVHNDENDTPAALHIKDCLARQQKASETARRAADRMNITKHTRVKKKEPSLKSGMSMAEIKDPSDGGRIRVMKRFGESTIDNWERSKKITPEAKEAADWFRARVEAAGIGSVSSIDFEKPLVDGGVPVTERSVGAILAADDVEAARNKIHEELGRVGPAAYGAMEDVVVHGLSLEQVAARWTDQTHRMGAGEMVGLVRHALNVIADWKQFIAKPERKMETFTNEKGEKERRPAQHVSHDPVTSFMEREVNHRGDVVEHSRSRIVRMEAEMRKLDAERKKIKVKA